MMTRRFTYGLGIGFAMHAAPAYISETSPPSVRGLLISLKEAAIGGWGTRCFGANVCECASVHSQRARAAHQPERSDDRWVDAWFSIQMPQLPSVCITFACSCLTLRLQVCKRAHTRTCLAKHAKPQLVASCSVI